MFWIMIMWTDESEIVASKFNTLSYISITFHYQSEIQLTLCPMSNELVLWKCSLTGHIGIGDEILA